MEAPCNFFLSFFHTCDFYFGLWQCMCIPRIVASLLWLATQNLSLMLKNHSARTEHWMWARGMEGPHLSIYTFIALSSIPVISPYNSVRATGAVIWERFVSGRIEATCCYMDLGVLHIGAQLQFDVLNNTPMYSTHYRTNRTKYYNLSVHLSFYGMWSKVCEQQCAAPLCVNHGSPYLRHVHFALRWWWHWVLLQEGD